LRRFLTFISQAGRVLASWLNQFDYRRIPAGLSHFYPRPQGRHGRERHRFQ
jgi:hypothetical protein